MKRQSVGMAASLGLLLACGAGSASAQYQPTYPLTPPPYSHYHFGNRAGLSPYLNLLRGGDPAANYFAGVVPAFQNRANFAQLRTAIQEIDQQNALYGTGTLDLARPLDQTGHPTAFGFYGSYYPQLGGRGGVGMGSAPGAGYRPR